MDGESTRNKRENYAEWIRKLFSPNAISERPEALRGVRVLEACAVLLGPATCDYLAEFGAEVIRIEPPAGDPARKTTPLTENYCFRTPLSKECRRHLEESNGSADSSERIMFPSIKSTSD